jgi:putative ABC transport system substrate-binding protein
MRRREFIAGLGSAAAWPLAARAQRPAIIGYLDLGPFEARREAVAAVHRGLSQTGYVEGRNLSTEYRWAEDDDLGQRWSDLATDLVNLHVSVIVAPGGIQALAAKAATQTIPIVFTSAVDPVEAGLVPKLNRPGGNLTGMSGLISTVASKRLGLLHQLVPTATTIGYLVRKDDVFFEPELRELQVAARTLGVRLLILNVSEARDFEAAFNTLVSERAGGLVVNGSKCFTGHADQLVPLAARNRLPAIYARREGTTAGGLISYGTDFPEMYRQVGIYTGRILNGEKPADLPVQQVTKMELVINMKTAKSLGIEVPATLLALADEVIE